MEAEGSMNYVVEKLREAEKEMGAENWTDYAVEKLRETERDMGPEEWIKYLVEKIKEWLVLLENLDETPTSKVDEVFPPQNRLEQVKHWVQVATPFIIAGQFF